MRRRAQREKHDTEAILSHSVRSGEVGVLRMRTRCQARTAQREKESTSLTVEMVSSADVMVKEVGKDNKNPEYGGFKS
jgi:hypothetical protein